MTSDAKELEKAKMQGHLPRFVEEKDGLGNTKYNIVAPKGFSGHVFVPRVDTNNKEVGHDLIEYRNGNVHRPGCLCLGKEGVGTSMMSATLQANVKPIPPPPQKKKGAAL